VDCRTEGLEYIIVKIYAACILRHHKGIFSRPISNISLSKKFELLGLKPIFQMLKIFFLLIRTLYAAFFELLFAMRYLQTNRSEPVLNI